MEERKQRWLKGSFTVEMAFLIPMILFLIMGCIRISFYYHDKNIIAGAAYETAVTGSTKVREKVGINSRRCCLLALILDLYRNTALRCISWSAALAVRRGGQWTPESFVCRPLF